VRNGRELEHSIERAVALNSGSEITEKEFVLETQGASGILGTQESDAPIPSLREAMDDLEQTLIGRALDSSGGNRTKAAQLLKIPRTALIYKIRKYEKL